MVEWRKSELIGQKRGEISGYPIRAEVYSADWRERSILKLKKQSGCPIPV
jgi:hypothetical protein